MLGHQPLWCVKNTTLWIGSPLATHRVKFTQYVMNLALFARSLTWWVVVDCCCAVYFPQWGGMFFAAKPGVTEEDYYMSGVLYNSYNDSYSDWLI